MALDYYALTDAQRKLYEATLTKSHRISVSFALLDSNEDYLDTFDGRVISGQVDVDLDADISRTLSLELVDDADRFAFGALGTIAADKFLAVDYKVWVEELASFVSVPVFHGPVSHFSRNGQNIQLEAQSKEALLLPPVAPMTPDIPASRSVAAWVKACAAVHGETLFGHGFAYDTKRLPKNYTAKAVNEVGLWPVMKGVARDADRQLFYDGRGYLNLRAWPDQSTAWTFADVIDIPSVSFDMKEARNTVKVYGADKRGRAVLRGQAQLPAEHELSPTTLARNGTKRVLLETIKTNSEKLTGGQATIMARRTLEQKSQGALDVSFSALPIPHLQPGDMVRVDTPYIATTFVLKKFSLPLSADGPMSIGHNAAVSVAQYRKALE